MNTIAVFCVAINFLFDSFNPAKDLTFMPVSGLNGLGLREQIDESICPWYRGDAFIPFIDALPSLNRKLEGPFIMPIVDKYKDMGTVVMGKVESGSAKKGQNLLVMPNRTQVSVDQLWSDDEEVTAVSGGENIKIKLKVSFFDALFSKVFNDTINCYRESKKKMSLLVLCYVMLRSQSKLERNLMRRS